LQAAAQIGRSLGLYDEGDGVGGDSGRSLGGGGRGFGRYVDENLAPLPGAALAGAALQLLLDLNRAFCRGLDPPPTIVPAPVTKIAAAAGGYARALADSLLGAVARAAPAPAPPPPPPPPPPVPPLLSAEGALIAAGRAAEAARRAASRDGLLRAAERAGEAARRARESALDAQTRAGAWAREARARLPPW
jgi:hypothetical protein